MISGEGDDDDDYILTRRNTVMTAQVKTTQEFCTSSATVAAFSLPVLISIYEVILGMPKSF